MAPDQLALADASFLESTSISNEGIEFLQVLHSGFIRFLLCCKGSTFCCNFSWE